MSERIDIVNIALTVLGADPITSLEDDAPEALVMKTNYPIARDATLEAYEWSFAIKRFKPAKAAEAPVWGWNFAYPIPSDILRVLQVDRNSPASFVSQTQLGQGNPRYEVQHVIEGRKILCNEDTIYCTGIRRTDDEGIYSNLFATALAMKLAMLTCYAITESNQKVENLAALYAGAIKEAKSRDGQQGSTRRLRSSWLRRVR